MGQDGAEIRNVMDHDSFKNLGTRRDVGFVTGGSCAKFKLAPYPESVRTLIETAVIKVKEVV